FVNSRQRRLKDDRVGSLGGDVTLHSERDSHRRCLHGGGIVYAVAQKERRSQAGFAAHDGNLVFRALGRVRLLDSDLLRQTPDFLISISGYNHDAVHRVPGLEMLDERPAFQPRQILEAKCRSILLVNKNQTLESRFPCPSTTTPSTGRISCGKMTSVSPTATSSRRTSLSAAPAFRCAICGIRLARASSTEEARRLANCSRAVPPESINITMALTGYSPRMMEVMMEMPARWSAPNSPARSFRPSTNTTGRPPTMRTARNGICVTVFGAP